MLGIALLWGGSALLGPYQPGDDPTPGRLSVLAPTVDDGRSLPDADRFMKFVSGYPVLPTAQKSRPGERNPWVPHSDLLPVEPAVLALPRALPTPVVLPPVDPFPMVPWYRNFRFDGIEVVPGGVESPFDGGGGAAEEESDELNEGDFDEKLLRGRSKWEFVAAHWDVVTFSNGTKWYGTISLKNEQRNAGFTKFMLLLRDDYQNLPFYFEKINTSNGRTDSSVTWTFAGSEVIRVAFRDDIFHTYWTMRTEARVGAKDIVALGRLVRDFLPLCDQEGYDRAEGLRLAVETMNEAHKVAPTDLETVLLLGETLHRSFKFDEELAIYRTLLKDRDPPAVHARIGRIYRKLGLRGREVDVLTRALALAPGDTRSRLNRAEAFYSLRRFEDAAGDFREVESSGTPEEQTLAREGRGRALLAQGKPAETVKVLNDAFDVRSRLTLGAARYALKDFAGAEQAFQEAVDQEPQSPAGLTLLGLAKAHTATDGNGIAAAIDLLNEARELDALNYFLPPLGAGFAEERRGDTVTSVDRYSAAATALPTAPYAHYALGRSYYRDGRYADAKDAFISALELDYRFVDALIGAGLASLELSVTDHPEKWADARAYLRRAVTLELREFEKSKSPETRRYLLLAHYRFGRTILLSEDLPSESRFRDAKLQMEACLALDDRFVPALNALGYIAYYEQDIDRALGRLEEAERLSPETPGDLDKSYASESKGRILEAESRRRWVDTFDRPDGPDIGNGWRPEGPAGIVPRLQDGAVVVGGRWPTNERKAVYLSRGTKDDELGDRFISARALVWSNRADKVTLQFYAFTRSAKRGIGTAAGIERTTRNTVVLISKTGTSDDWERTILKDEDGKDLLWPDGWSNVRIERVDPAKGVLEISLGEQVLGRVDVGLRKRPGLGLELSFQWSAGGGDLFESKIDEVEMELYAK